MPDIFVAEKKDKSNEFTLREDAKEKVKETSIIKPKEAEKRVANTAKEDEIKDVGKEVGLFHSFCINPIGIKFANQDAGEKILLFLRRHLITNVPWIFRTIVLLLIPPALSFFSRLFGVSFNFLPIQYNFFILLFYFYVVFLFAFVDFISWFYNIGLVTNERVFDVDLKNLVYTHVAATKIEQIEDVSYKRTGAIRSIFDYGDVEIQTAAENENFDFLAVPRPNEAVNIVEDLIKGGQD
jgi:hypothetical protein